MLFESENIKLYLQKDKTEIVFVAKNHPSFQEWKKAFIIGVQYVKKSYFVKDRPLVNTWTNDLTELSAIGGEHQCFLQKYVNDILKKLNPPLLVCFYKPRDPIGYLAMKTYLIFSEFFSCKKNFARFKIL